MNRSFPHILEQCMKFHLVDTSTVFVDSTHVKACANSKKMRKRIASQEALWYEEELKKEINEDRKNHGKKPLKEKRMIRIHLPQRATALLVKAVLQTKSRKEPKRKNAVLQIRKAAGSEKANINMFLHTA